MRTAFGLMVLLGAATASAQDSVAGSWTVTATETGTGTCQMTPGKVTATVWIISTQPDGTVVVHVQGQTPFPVMGGKLDGDTLVLQAYANIKGRTEATWIRLKLTEGEMFGVRRHLSVQPQQFSKKKVTAPCFLDLDISAKKTG